MLRLTCLTQFRGSVSLLTRHSQAASMSTSVSTLSSSKSPSADSTTTNVSHESSSSYTCAPSSPASALLSDAFKKGVIDRMIRVDHAGEVGARRIYAGQLAVFNGTSVGNVISEMAEQELKHLRAFEGLIRTRRVRPTALLPLWNVAGYVLGVGTALLGKEAAMACTVAVEEVIAEHYNDQVRVLLGEGWQHEAELRAMFREFRDDELEHKDTGIAYDAESAPFYKALSAVIKAGCKAAIATTERI